ncbi:hypothetical protein O181_039861 [Austropuccinia psidii MF-1]|uniref:Ubiquitin-like protease family profile domain-containing protein n=1 Tax=Austropuccinia psidii MF-1 TaxID=1389203 RepID=A0A9Q3DAD3_9BASI|nr:hypothetical protein [Austropuccinia psidii MF-1]
MKSSNSTSNSTSSSTTPSYSLQRLLKSNLTSHLTQNETSTYKKRPPLLLAHNKKLALKLKLDTIRDIMNNPPTVNSSVTSNLPISRLLTQDLAVRLPQKQYQQQISQINEKDNLARLFRNQTRFTNSFPKNHSDIIFQTRLATLDSPRPPEPQLPTYNQLLDRQRQLDQTFGKKKVKRRRWRKSLEPDKMAFVQEILQTRGKISQLPGAYCESHDIRKLKPKQWMNDEIATFYGVMINLRSAEYEKKTQAGQAFEDEKFLRAHCFSSFFMEKYDREGFKGVQRWSKKFDLFQKDVIIFPVNIANAHWTCAAINLKNKRFEFYDSMGNRNDSVLANLRDYIVNEALAKKKQVLDLSGWIDFYPMNVPQQDNAYDCGIFVCQFMDSLSRDWGTGNAEFDFSQENMPYIRTKMIYEIAKCKFLPERWE